MAKTPRTPPEPVPAARTPRKSGRPTSAKSPAAQAKAAKAKAPNATTARQPAKAPAPKATPEPAPATREAAAPTEASSGPGLPFALAGADQQQMLETLSLNLARAAMTAQSAIAEAALSQADRPAALSPDPFNVGPAMNSVMTSLASRPDKTTSAARSRPPG